MTGPMQAADGRFQVQVERDLRHAPARVWRAFTDPAELSQWYPLTVRTLDLRSGGVISFDDGEGATYHGVITVLDPPPAFAFREENDLLHIALKPTPDGCRLTLTHTFDDPSGAERTRQGWSNCLEALMSLLAQESIQDPAS